MNNTTNPELHVNEEPRNDFSDVGTGFAVMFAFMVVVFFGAVIVKAFIS